MADTQTPETLPPPSQGGIPFSPKADYVNDVWTIAPNEMELQEMIKAGKPKNDGELLSNSMADYLIDQKKNYQGVKKSDEQLSNRMIAQKADVVNSINTQPDIQAPDDAAQKELKKQKEEFNRDFFGKYDIPADKRKEGVIIPIPKGYKSDYLDKIGVKNPAWTGNYIQLRKDPDTGDLSWQGYNKPSVVEGKGDITVYSTKFKDEGFTEQTDPVTGLKVKVPTDDIKKFWDKDANSKDYSEGAIRATGLLKKMESAGNYRVTKLMANNPELWSEFKKQTEYLTGQDLTEEGSMQAAQKALEKSFKMDQPLSSVAPHYTEWSIMDAIQKQNDFVDYTDKFNQNMDNLSAKIRLAGEADLYKTMPKEFDRLHELEAQMMRDPKSVTPPDQKEYNRLKVLLTTKTVEAMKDSPLSNAFKIQANEYQDRYKKHIKDVELLGTEEGQAALNLLSTQAKGYELQKRLPDYFPGVKKAEKEQDKLNDKSDKFSAVKTFVRGIQNSVENLRAGAMRGLGFTEEAIGNEVTREKAGQWDLRTPVRDTKGSVWNSIANFTDNTAEFVGSMVPYIAVTAATGGEGATGLPSFLMREGAPFFTSGYNDYYREARGQGLTENEARLKGVLGGTALLLSQSLVPKGQMLDRGLINKEISDLVAKGTVDKSMLVDFFKKFVEGGGHGLAAVTANGLADYAMNSYLNATKGTNFNTDQLDPENLLKQGLMFGVMASVTNSIANFGSKDAARAMVIQAAEAHPLATLRSIDDALVLAKTDKSYNEIALHKLKSEVGEALQMKYPADFSREQRIATFDLVKKKQELEKEMAGSDEAFHESYKNKIKYIDDQLRDIADKQTAAEKHLDKISDPLYKKMEAEGYFDKPKPEAKPAPEGVEEKSATSPVIARHGETEANRRGIIGAENEPLNEKGKQQAKELGKQFKAQGIENVVTSGLDRSVETGEAVVKETGGKAIVNEKLNEWKTGQEGSPSSSFDEKYYVNHPDEKPAGGESFNEFLSRVQGAKEEIKGLNDKTAVITHSKVLKLMDVLDKNNGEWNEKAKAEYLKEKDFDNGSAYKDGKKIDPKEAAKAEQKENAGIHDDKIQERYGRKPEEVIKQMKDEGVLKIKCPTKGTPRGSKFIKSLSGLGK